MCWHVFYTKELRNSMDKERSGQQVPVGHVSPGLLAELCMRGGGNRDISGQMKGHESVLQGLVQAGKVTQGGPAGKGKSVERESVI